MREREKKRSHRTEQVKEDLTISKDTMPYVVVTEGSHQSVRLTENSEGLLAMLRQSNERCTHTHGK
ncbi:hypothetical protein E2C01_036592 [Portunus trituberculatus]|uniref:Uncharacterized protein n=1 Tax=Portunus trituberculatus TaxID=210409 RepID=A0A5B7FBL1_PORTR|nr:hypothetical protein [Portunus trituberculatus]